MKYVLGALALLMIASPVLAKPKEDDNRDRPRHERVERHDRQRDTPYSNRSVRRQREIDRAVDRQERRQRDFYRWEKREDRD